MSSIAPRFARTSGPSGGCRAGSAAPPSGARWPRTPPAAPARREQPAVVSPALDVGRAHDHKTSSIIAPVRLSAPPRSNAAARAAGASRGIRRDRRREQQRAPGPPGAKNTQRQPRAVSSPPATMPEREAAGGRRRRRRAGPCCVLPSGKLGGDDRQAGGGHESRGDAGDEAGEDQHPAFVANPPSPEKARNTTSQARNIRRRPSRSAARPPSSTKPP